MKTVKTLIASVVIAVAAFSSVSANAAFRMALDNGNKLVIAQDEQSALIKLTDGSAIRFRAVAGAKHQLDNNGEEYTVDRFLATNGSGAMISLKVYENVDDSELFIFNAQGKVIETGSYPTSAILSTN